jgi:uncharacterized protein (DUF4415 family)
MRENKSVGERRASAKGGLRRKVAKPELAKHLAKGRDVLVTKDDLGKIVHISGSRRQQLVYADDAPELTEEFFERADVYHGNKLVRAGRPRSENPKLAIKLRIDPDVVEHFRATGPGWQTRINDTLRKAVKLPAKELTAAIGLMVKVLKGRKAKKAKLPPKPKVRTLRAPKKPKLTPPKRPPRSAFAPPPMAARKGRTASTRH